MVAPQVDRRVALVLAAGLLARVTAGRILFRHVRDWLLVLDEPGLSGVPRLALARWLAASSAAGAAKRPLRVLPRPVWLVLLDGGADLERRVVAEEREHSQVPKLGLGLSVDHVNDHGAHRFRCHLRPLGRALVLAVLLLEPGCPGGVSDGAPLRA